MENNSEADEQRGLKRRASTAFSEDGEFRGFDDGATVEGEFKGFTKSEDLDVSKEYTKVVGEFTCFILLCNNLLISHYRANVSSHNLM